MSDHCKALRMVLENGGSGEIYNIGSGARISNLELAKGIIHHLDLSPNLIEFVSDRKGHDYSYMIDSRKISEEIGWEPLIKFETGLRATIDWYEKNSRFLGMEQGS